MTSDKGVFQMENKGRTGLLYQNTLKKIIIPLMVMVNFIIQINHSIGMNLILGVKDKNISLQLTQDVKNMNVGVHKINL